jgi:hypothetical protein
VREESQVTRKITQGDAERDQRVGHLQAGRDPAALATTARLT